MLGIFVKRHAMAVAEVADVASLFVYPGDQDGIEETEENGVYTIKLTYKRVKNSIPVISAIMKLKKYNDAWLKAVNLYEKKRGRPDIVNLNVIVPAGNVAMYLKRKWNVPYIITEHWTGYFPEDGRYKGTLIKTLTQRAVQSASAVVTVSNDLKNQMLKCGLNNDYTVISNVVDTDIFTINKTKVADGKIRFIHVSSLDDAQKNVSGIIKVFKKFHGTHPDSELTIVGNGDEKAKLEGLNKSLGLVDAVHFVGAKTQNELVGLLQNATAFVLFSNYETQAIVLLEALCCGIPVIATKAGGISEYVNEKNGILIDVKSEDQLFNAMEVVANDKSRFGNAEDIRASVVHKVNAKSIANQFLDVYNKVLNRR